ncbi:MAG: multi-sensor signal transduction histidine kinase [uncultured bacterium]|nr:MAG: multi-sensor signal transduction histidine kinase [uncultured bacterium]
MKELTPQILEKKLIFQENYDSSIPTIFVDPKLISIVIENLMSNAVKYTPNNGKISLEVKKEGDSVILKVSDTGVGIPENQQNKIFSKLFRADNAKEIDPDGAGLGLYIVKEIIDHSVGTIWFESQEGKGTTFYVKLPLSGMQKRGGARKLE